MKTSPWLHSCKPIKLIGYTLAPGSTVVLGMFEKRLELQQIIARYMRADDAHRVNQCTYEYTVRNVELKHWTKRPR